MAKTDEGLLRSAIDTLHQNWDELNSAYQDNPTPERLAAMCAVAAAANAVKVGLAILTGERKAALSWRRETQADLRRALTRAGILVGGKPEEDSHTQLERAAPTPRKRPKRKRVESCPELGQMISNLLSGKTVDGEKIEED